MKPGERLGPYLLREELGAGASGRVFLADEDESGEGPQSVALKVFHPHLTGHAGFVARFEREAEAGRRVVHDNVVRVLEAEMLVLDGEPTFFLVMEPVAGRTLRRLVRDLGPLPEPLIREIGRQAAAGLGAVHAAGLVHRDVKPDNLILTDDGRLRIMDLGVARQEDATVALTNQGAFVGTIAYAAPEVLDGAPASPAADLYALGVTLHELATGRNPFVRESMAAIVHAHRHALPPPVEASRPDVSPFLDALVADLLEKRPDGRPRDAATVAEAFANGEASAWWTGRAPRVGVERRRRRPDRPVLARETTLVGREEESAALREGFLRARAGDGNALWLEGEAGIGKSRVLDAFLDEVEGEARVVFGGYAPTGVEGAFARSLRGLVAERPQALAERLGPLAAFAPVLAAEIGGLPLPAGVRPLTPEARGSVYARVLDSLAREEPLVWVVEDLHFAPPDERALVLRLARETAGRRAFLIVTTRPGPPDAVAEWSRIPGATRRVMGRLSPREVILVLQQLLGSPSLAERLGGRIAWASDGVPHYLFEIVRGLRDGSFLSVTPEGAWIQTKDIEHVAVPASLGDVIRGRLADLAPDDRALLDAAAVVGFEFDPEVVAEVLGRRLIPVLQTLATLERRSGLVRSSSKTTRFDHHLVQEFLYEEVPPRLRAEYHALVGAVLGSRPADEEGVVSACRHHLAGSHPDRAGPLVERALSILSRGNHWTSAADLGGRALDVPGLLTGRDRDGVLARVALACHQIGRYPEQSRRAAERLELARSLGDPLRLAEACTDNAEAFTRRGDLEEALRFEERAAEILRDAGAPPALVAASDVSVAGKLGSLGRWSDALSRLEALRAAMPARPEFPHGPALTNLYSIYTYLGDWRAADRAAAECIAWTDRLGIPAGASRAREQRAGLLCLFGRFSEAQELLAQALDLARRNGLGTREGGALHRRATVELGLGDLMAARDTATLSESVAATCDDLEALVYSRSVLVQTSAWSGDVATARSAFDRIARNEASRAGNPIHRAIHMLGFFLDALEDDSRAALCALEARRAGTAWTGTLAIFADLTEVELAARAGVRRDGDLVRLRDLERTLRALPYPALVWRAVALRAMLGDADRPTLAEVRAETEANTGHPERLRNQYLVWRATGDEGARAAALAVLARMREGLGPPIREIPFVAELLAAAPTVTA